MSHYRAPHKDLNAIKPQILQTLNLSVPKCTLERFFNRGQISCKNSKLLWSFRLGTATEVHLSFKDGGQKNIGHNMSIVLDTRKSNFVSQ